MRRNWRNFSRHSRTTGLNWLVNIVAYYGMHRSEVLALKWDCIDFDKKKIIIRRKLVYKMCENGDELVVDEQLKTSKCQNTPINAVASLLLANGVPMKAIQEWLGHSIFNVTADFYSHLKYSSKSHRLKLSQRYSVMMTKATRKSKQF